MKISIVAPLELQEYLFADTSAQFAVHDNEETPGQIGQVRDHIRGALRIQRFNVMNWLVVNGVSIPAELLDDALHQPVGYQYPDSYPLDLPVPDLV